MNKPEERLEFDLNGVIMSPELLELLRMTQGEGNEYLDAHVNTCAEAICYIASMETIVDDEQSQRIRFVLIKELSMVRKILQKMGRTVLIAIFALLEPELLSNLYELGDIYIY